MTDAYRAFHIHRGADEQSTRAGIAQRPYTPPRHGEVLIRVQWSSVNYKDALACTGRLPILRVDELDGGIDLAGVVVETADDRVSEGDEVLVHGCSLSESHDGGYAEYARVPADWVVPIGGALDARRAMLIGTAGFTAAMALHAMQVNGQTPQMGPVAVTGASGGVGSFAVNLLARLGYECVALSRSQDAGDYLRALGASRIGALPSDDDTAPLARAEWGGAVDNLGGDTLAYLLKTTHMHGNVTSIGLAQSARLATSVMPFIIRGVNLLGVTSTNCPMPLRRELWQRLGAEWLPDCFDDVLADTVTLDTLDTTFSRILNGEVRGRILVDLSGEASRD